MLWASSVHTHLASAELPHDIKSAEQMQKEHDEVLDDIKAHKDKSVNPSTDQFVSQPMSQPVSQLVNSFVFSKVYTCSALCVWEKEREAERDRELQWTN